MSEEGKLTILFFVLVLVFVAGYLLGNNRAQSRYNFGFYDGFIYRGGELQKARNALGQFRQKIKQHDA